METIAKIKSIIDKQVTTIAEQDRTLSALEHQQICDYARVLVQFEQLGEGDNSAYDNLSLEDIEKEIATLVKQETDARKNHRGGKH